MLIVNAAICILFVYRYAMKVRRDPTKSQVYSSFEEDKKYFASFNVDTVENFTRRQKWVVRIFVLTFVIMIASLIPWDQLNKNFTFFDTFTNWLKQVPVLGVVLGQGMIPFGTWYFRELCMLFLVSAILIGFVYTLPESDFIGSFLEGAKDLLGVALIIGIAKGIQVVMNDGQITATILHWGEIGLKGLPKMAFAVLVYIFYLPLSFLIPSTLGLAAATMGIMGPMASFSHVSGHVVVTAYQTANGIVNLITPTSGVVVGALSISRISFGSWVRYVIPLIAILFVVDLVFISVLSIL